MVGPKMRQRAFTPLIMTAFGLLAAASAQAQQPIEIVHSFARAPVFQTSRLVRGSDGTLYGTTIQGGKYGFGTVFALRHDADDVWTTTVLHAFNGSDGNLAVGGLALGPAGAIYGTTVYGGTHGDGTVFKIDSDGSFGVVHSFKLIVDGANPLSGLVLGNDGAFYGTTNRGIGNGGGTVFRMTASGTTTTLHQFTNPNGTGSVGLYSSLTLGADGNLYGTTYVGGTSNFGTVYRVSPSGAFVQLHAFAPSEGTRPLGQLAQVSSGELYGTTTSGTKATMFKLTPAGLFTVVHFFNEGTPEGGGLLLASDGDFYATLTDSNQQSGENQLFRATSSGTVTLLGPTFAPSIGGLVEDPADGTLYFATYTGGTTNGGKIVRVKRGQGPETLFSFDASEGLLPLGGLVQARDGNFYGTTTYGGSGSGSEQLGFGSVFRMTPAGEVTTIYSFEQEGFPKGSLVEAADGYLYGTDLHQVFRVSLSGDWSVLHQFDPAVDGWMGSLGLIQGSDGALYGTTLAGGSPAPAAFGTVFRVTTSGEFTVLHTFHGADGKQSIGRLVQGRDGLLYGTTQYGGNADLGTVFRLSLSGADFTTLHSFAGSDGARPIGGLLQASDDNFYGTTYSGGYPNPFGSPGDGLGTVFTISGSGVFTVLRKFFELVEGSPAAALVEANDGYLYGTLLTTCSEFRCGGAGKGAVVRMAKSGLWTRTLGPGLVASSLVQGRDGFLYGISVNGGTSRAGSVFRLPQVMAGQASLAVTSTSGCFEDTCVTNMKIDGEGFAPLSTVTTTFWLSGVDENGEIHLFPTSFPESADSAGSFTHTITALTNFFCGVHQESVEFLAEDTAGFVATATGSMLCDQLP